MTTLIVDDHERFRTSARVLLEMEGFDVVGEAADGAAAVSNAERLRPDFVLLDIQLPDAKGYEVARVLLSRGLTQRVILVSSRDESDYGDSLRTSGALGFVPKADLSGERLRTLLSRESSCN